LVRDPNRILLQSRLEGKAYVVGLVQLVLDLNVRVLHCFVKGGEK
jgi:hypothetical protein